MERTRAIVLALFSFTLVTQLSAQRLPDSTIKKINERPNYSGTWILNLQKSQIQADWAKGLTKGVFIITQYGDTFTLSRYFIIKGKKKKLHIKMIADGNVRRKKILFKGKLEWKENNLQATIFRNGFLNIVNYRYGNNQYEFIADEVFTGRPQDYHNHWVFERDKQLE